MGNIKKNKNNIKKELLKFRRLHNNVMENLADYLLPAEFYMLKVIANQKLFKRNELEYIYASIFRKAKNLCRKSYGQPTNPADYLSPCGDVDLNLYQPTRNYLIYRFNGGSMLKDFKEFRPDIQLTLVSLLKPAEIYFLEYLRNTADAGEFAALDSHPRYNRRNEYEKIRFQVSSLCGDDAPNKLKIKRGYDSIITYIIQRLLI